MILFEIRRLAAWTTWIHFVSCPRRYLQFTVDRLPNELPSRAQHTPHLAGAIAGGGASGLYCIRSIRSNRQRTLLVRVWERNTKHTVDRRNDCRFLFTPSRPQNRLIAKVFRKSFVPCLNLCLCSHHSYFVGIDFSPNMA